MSHRTTYSDPSLCSKLKHLWQWLRTRLFTIVWCNELCTPGFRDFLLSSLQVLSGSLSSLSKDFFFSFFLNGLKSGLWQGFWRTSTWLSVSHSCLVLPCRGGEPLAPSELLNALDQDICTLLSSALPPPGRRHIVPYFFQTWFSLRIETKRIKHSLLCLAMKPVPGHQKLLTLENWGGCAEVEIFDSGEIMFL